MIALVTCASARHLDEDLDALHRALEAVGCETVIVDWHDRAVDWGAFSLTVLRSTWDYPQRRDDFLAWCRATAKVTELCNDPDVVAWSSDKSYLSDLDRSGVPITPTTFLPVGTQAVMHIEREIVIKPSIGAGSIDATRFAPEEASAARDHVAMLHATGRTALVQPYLPAVEETGETALVYFDGAFSHAFRKGAMLVPGKELVDGLFLEERIDPRTPTGAELAVGAAALACVPRAGAESALVYARVDLVPADDGSPVVLELELVEPSVYLRTSPGAADRFADAITQRLTRQDPRARG